MANKEEIKISNTLSLATQKAHFEEYDVAIRLLIEVIKLQQRQINELKEMEANNDRKQF